MSLLQELPTQERFTEILKPIIGDGEGGVGAVAKLLEDIDTSSISSAMASKLDGALASVVPTAAATGPMSAVLGQFEAARQSFPSDSQVLVAPIRDKVGELVTLSSGQLSTSLGAAVTALTDIQALLPSETLDLFSEVTPAVDRVKAELTAGELGQLRQWSEGVTRLGDELRVQLAAGEGTVEERLIRCLTTKVSDLLRLVMPHGVSHLDALTGGLGAAVNADRVAALATIRTALVAEMTQARADIGAGIAAQTPSLGAAEIRFQELTSAVDTIRADLVAILDRPIATAAGLAAAIDQQLTDFERVEIVDVGNVRDRFVAALAKLEQAIRELHLEKAGQQVTELFDRINDAIARVDLGALSEQVAAVQQRLDSVIDRLDAAVFEIVASVGALLQRVRESLRSIAGALGTFDEEGRFHFSVESQLREFLQGLQHSIGDTVMPMIADFRATIGETLTQVQELLASAKEQIDAAKQELESALAGVVTKLEEADVPGKLEDIGTRLDGMLDDLGEVNFDVVVDPVVAEIGEMRDTLAKIDVSSMNETLRGALKVAVQVIVSLDFTSKITDVLMAKIDEVLAYPINAINEIEVTAESGLKRLTDLAPGKILSPLDDVFDPVRKALDELQLDRLLEPLNAWHARAMQEIEKVSPASLLVPVVDIFLQIETAASAISPDGLIAAVRQALDDAAGELRGLDLGSVTAELDSRLGQMRAALDALAPEQVFTPLVSAFGKVTAAVDSFRPSVLLQPVGAVFEKLTAPLENLTDAHARSVEIALRPLIALPSAFDATTAFATAGAASSATAALLRQVDVGQLMVDLKGPYDALRAAAAAAGADDAIMARVEALNPLREERLGRAVTELRDAASRLERAFPSPEPPAELARRYESVRANIESLVPEWAKDPITPASIRRAFQLANPASVTEEVDRVYDALRDQLRALDPAQLQEQVRETFDRLKKALYALDPTALVNGVRGVTDRVAQKLSAIDLTIIGEELSGTAADVRAVIAGLDPRPIIAELESLASAVKDALRALRPSDLLAELKEPLETGKAIVMAFDPASLREPLQKTFEGIQAVIAKIDVGVVLQPLIDKLEELRDELEAALRRTQAAFDEMVAAIPL